MIELPDDYGSGTKIPIVTFMPIIKTSDFEAIGGAPQYAIQIGCLYSDEHVNVEGDISSYTELFENLSARGYDPLSLIRGEKARLHTGRMITSIIKKNARSERSYHNIRPSLMALARDIRDAVRDYISGELSIPSFSNGSSANKAPLDGSTVKKRESRERRGMAPYNGASGIEEPLMETGRLYKAIRYRVIRVADFGSQYRKKMSASLKSHYEKTRRGGLTARQMRKSEETMPIPAKKVSVKGVKTNALDAFFEALRNGTEIDPALQRLAQRRFDSILSQIVSINALLADPETTFEGRNAAKHRLSELYRECAKFGYSRREIEEFL